MCKEQVTLLMQAWGGDCGSGDGGAAGGGIKGAGRTTAEVIGSDIETMLTPSTAEAAAVSLASCVISSLIATWVTLERPRMETVTCAARATTSPWAALRDATNQVAASGALLCHLGWLAASPQRCWP